MSYMLLTGATGLLGRFLMRDALLSGMRLAVLARATRRESGRQRVDAVLRLWEQQLGRRLPRPVVFEGSLCDPHLGLSPSDRDWIRRRCDAVIHAAASISFHEDLRTGEPFRSNVEGVEHLLRFCHEQAIRRMHAVSTAYVCGLADGLVEERDAARRPEYGNDYEASKHLGERLMRDDRRLDSLTIYRPSILVGDWRTGYTSTFHGFYKPLQLAHAIAESKTFHADSWKTFLQRLGLSGDERKNLTPVDWASAAITLIASQPRLHGRTYHLTNRTTVPISAITAAIVDVVKSTDGRRGGIEPLPVDVDDEQAFAASMAVYRANLRDDPDFDSTNTQAALPDLPCPPIDASCLARLARFAVEARFVAPRPPAAPSDVTVDDCLAPLRLDEDGRHSTQRRQLQLEVVGSGGGVWQAHFNGLHLLGVAPGLDDHPAAELYLNFETFTALRRGDLSLDAALASGGCLLIGRQASVAVAAQLASRLFEQLARSTSVIAPAPTNEPSAVRTADAARPLVRGRIAADEVLS